MWANEIENVCSNLKESVYYETRLWMCIDWFQTFLLLALPTPILYTDIAKFEIFLLIHYKATVTILFKKCFKW